MPDDQDKPTFGKLRDALMPPGTDKAALWSALKNAQVTGGHIPGRPAPDISMAPVVTDLSGSGIRPEVLRALSGARSLEDVADALAEPADPFTGGAPAAAALHEMFLDFIGAGFTEDQATSILGKMLAAYGAADKDGQ